jgi:hypothetical protein
VTWIVSLLWATVVALGFVSGDFTHGEESAETSVHRAAETTSCDELRTPNDPLSVDVASTIGFGDEAYEAESSEEEGAGLCDAGVAEYRNRDDSGCACKPAVDFDGNGGGSFGFAARAPPVRVRPRR